jgi:choline dehydrogenase-like flavoprotein
MRHMTGSVYGVVDQPVHMYRGTTMAGIVRDEATLNTKRGFVGGYELETLSLGLPFLAAFLEPGAWGRGFTAAMEDCPNMAGMWIVGEDMPQETNRITLDPKAKDKNGLPVASVHFDDHDNDVKMRARDVPFRSHKTCGLHLSQYLRRPVDVEIAEEIWCVRRDSNPQPTGSKPVALSS